MAINSPKHGLTRHARGGWYKSINGVWKLVAGKREATTGEEADRVYERRFKELWGGAPPTETPRPLAAGGGVTLKDLFDQYIHAKRMQKEASKLDPRTFDEYEDALQDFLGCIGAAKAFDELAPFDFTGVYQKWSARFGPSRLGKYVTIVRQTFTWLDKQHFIPTVPAYGDFRQPTRADFRRHQAEKEERGQRSTFTPNEVCDLLNKADVQMRAAVLLGLNGGFGNTDLSELRLRVVDLDKGWIDYRRGKTAVKRRCPLWPETIAAIRDALPLCKITGNVFSTSDGRPLVQGTHDRLAARFKTLCEAANCYLEDRGFYALRHTFATEAVKHGPTLFVKRITGHTSPDEDRVLDEHYVGGVDSKLCEIVEGVRHALLNEKCSELLGVPLPAAPKPPKPVAAEEEAKPRRKGKPQSRDGEKPSRGRSAAREASPLAEDGGASSG